MIDGLTPRPSPAPLALAAAVSMQDIRSSRSERAVVWRHSEESHTRSPWRGIPIPSSVSGRDGGDDRGVEGDGSLETPHVYGEDAHLYRLSLGSIVACSSSLRCAVNDFRKRPSETQAQDTPTDAAKSITDVFRQARTPLHRFCPEPVSTGVSAGRAHLLQVMSKGHLHKGIWCDRYSSLPLPCLPSPVRLLCSFTRTKQSLRQTTTAPKSLPGDPLR